MTTEIDPAVPATDIPPRLLLGSGPSPVPPRVLAALAQPTIGHMDPAFADIMSETIELMRQVFQTENVATLPISGTGSAGMEALVANFVDPGDRVVCGVNGLFGVRMADELARAGAEVVQVKADWGRAIAPEQLIAAASAAKTDAIVVVHGETSTGVVQSLEGLADACRERDALLLIDCVTSLGGHPLRLDEAGVDAAFSGTQKCLNCPPASRRSPPASARSPSSGGARTPAARGTSTSRSCSSTGARAPASRPPRHRRAPTTTPRRST